MANAIGTHDLKRSVQCCALFVAVGMAAWPGTAWAQAPARDYVMPNAPTDVQPGSITYEEVPYPIRSNICR